MSGRDRWQRGQHGETKAFDWYLPAHELRVPHQRARQLYEHATERAQHVGLHAKELYLAMLHAEAAALRAIATPGKQTRVLEQAEAASPQKRRPRREADIPVPGRTTLVLKSLDESPSPTPTQAPPPRTAGLVWPSLTANTHRPSDRGSALREVSLRRAAAIFRDERKQGEVDPHDPTVQKALDRARQGQPLADAVLREMQARLGADFRDVRVHTDEVAARAAEALHAKAFTLGADIFFAAGQFAPDSEAGQRLLVHELTHVVQSQQGRVPTSRATTVSRPSDALEHEAATAYDRSTPPPTRQPRPGPVLAPVDKPTGMLLRDPQQPNTAKAPLRDIAWLSWDAKLIIGFVDGMVRVGGKPLSADERARLERDFKDPISLLKIDAGLKVGMAEGAFLSLEDNILAIGQIVKWVFWNMSLANQLEETYEWISDPVGKLAREQETSERRLAFIQGMGELAWRIVNDSGIAADLGEELGEVAGEYIARAHEDFANAPPFSKGRMVGKGIGYVAMEIALLFVGPEMLVAKVPAAIARIARSGGKVAQTLLRLMSEIPALRKLLKAAGWLEKASEALGPEAKILSHLEASLVKKVMHEGLKAEEVAALAKLDKATAEKLLRELSGREVLDLEQKLGRAELERLAKDKSVKEIQAAAEKAVAEKAAAEKAAAVKKAALAKLEAKGLDPAKVQRFANLDHAAIDNFATLDKSALERFAQLDDAALHKFGNLSSADLSKFQKLDEAALKKFALLEDSRLKQFANTFDAKALKDLGAMDLASFTEPRTTVEALDHAGGHSHGKHGAQTTPAQHEHRLKTGEAPDGTKGPIPADSGKFISDEKHLEAAKLADEGLLQEARNAKGTKFKKKVEVPFAQPGAGISYTLDASGHLIARPADKVTAIYELVPGANGDRYILLTMYPHL